MKKYVFPIGLLILLVLVSCTTGAPEGTPLLDGDDESMIVTETLAPTASPQQADQDESSVEPSTEALPEELAIVQERAVARCKQLVEAFDQKKMGNPGWVHIVEEITHFTNPTREYLPKNIYEQWYLVDSDGYFVEAYGWGMTSEGVVDQESVYINGWIEDVRIQSWVSLEYDVDPEGELNGPLPVSENQMILISEKFCNRMEGYRTGSISAVEYNGKAAIQFSYIFQTDPLYDGDPLIKSLYFDQDSFWLLGYETYWVQPNGNLKNIHSHVYTTYEFNADPPEERFAEIWARVPHVDTFVPVEEGQP